MTLSRHVQLKTLPQGGVCLVQTPVEESKSLRGQLWSWSHQEIDGPSLLTKLQEVLSGIEARGSGHWPVAAL